MKKLISSFFFFCLWINSSHSQIVFNETHMVVEFDSLEFDYETDSEYINNYYQNTSDEDLNIRWTFDYSSCIEEWDMRIDDSLQGYGFDSYTNVNDSLGINSSVPIPAQGEREISIDFWPRLVPGCCQVYIELSLAENPPDSVLATAFYDIYYDVPEGCSISNTSESDFLLAKIYPNPTSGLVKIESEYAVESVHVLSVHGQHFGEIYLSGNNEMDMSYLPSGIYLMKIEMENGAIGWAKINRL